MAKSFTEYMSKYVNDSDIRISAHTLFGAMKDILVNSETFFSAQDLINESSSSLSSNALEFKFIDVVKHKYTTDYNHWSISVDLDENTISIFRNDDILIMNYYKNVGEKKNGLDLEIMNIMTNKFI